MKLLNVILAVSFPLVASAAVPKTVPKNISAAYDILKLPSENQKGLIEKQPDRVYDDFMSLAFDDKITMNVRWKALMAGAQMRKGKATPDLLRAAKHSQWFMRTAAITALAEYDPGQATEVARGLIKDKALVVRSAAVDWLAQDAAPEVRGLFWSELKEKYNFKNKKSLWIRPQLVHALSKKPLDQETSMFAELLKESDLKIQLSAVRALERLTGMKMGDASSSVEQLVSLWRKQYN